ncbi:MAG: Arginine-tRNA ligase [Candidatus Magasanikbacteria bacterium GW2011_GWA2_46_17]|uniref:Arginine--tRNA ligase n=1 Tax=Candidatus Magasanikbacteria bacterium GW2011_GWA2_46_17 TaxID=1619042 RepID=A0A0G1S256_9BACT|nr:MAG: Arginine-tRNA ligase [Candidatus Magasanikbacteria bacterium GW2011_GWA2_46_17]
MVELQIIEILKKFGVTGAIELTTPPNPGMGDLAFACFGLAKEWKMSSAAVAVKLKFKIEDLRLKIVERVETDGPYLNFYLNTSEVAKLVIGQIKKEGEKYGSTKIGKGKKVMIEYPSNNTHKEFHIGHFRNVCVGNLLVQLYKKTGHTVYPVNYLNDFGSHVAKCLWGLKKFHLNETSPENKQKWLGQIYAEASNYLKDHPEAQSEVAEVQKKLESEDKGLWPLFLETRQWSIDKFEELFGELSVYHEAVFYEKDLKQQGHKLVDELLKKGIAKVGEGGAIIVDLTPFKLDIALARKSDGAGLYLTSDLPLAKEKFKKFDVDESITITGQEQIFYFKQLFKVLELLGFKKKLTHISYGLVNLPEGKMSSRTGRVILYEDLRDSVYAKMYGETKERHAGEWDEEKIVDTAKSLCMAALKFDTQKHEAAKNIVFDIKEATSFEGFSGPYVLYVVARINSLLKKSKVINLKSKVSVANLRESEEKRLLLLMDNYGEVVEKALKEYNPSVIARYCFDLAQAFNDYYNKHSVLKAETQELISARLALAGSVSQILRDALDLLTIETVKEM